MRPLLLISGWLILCTQTGLSQTTPNTKSPTANSTVNVEQAWLAPVLDATFVDANGRPVAAEAVQLPFQSKRKENDRIWTGEVWVPAAKALPVTEALKHYTEFVSDPKAENKSEAYRRRAELYRHRGELTFALLDFNRVIRQQPELALALAGRGAIYRLQGSYDRAAQDLEAANRLKVNDPKILIELGRLALDRGDATKALSIYESALKLSPNSASVLQAIGAAYARQEKLDEAIERYDAAYKAEPSLQLLFERANIHFRAAHLDEARHDIEKVLRADPKNAAGWTLHGLIHARRGDDQRALSSFERAVVEDSDSPVNRHNLGVLHLKLKQYPLATNDLQDALRLDPDFVPSLLSAAWLFTAAKETQALRPDLAIVLTLRALELTQHKNSDAYNILASAYAQRGAFDDAVRCQKEAIELAKNNKASATDIERLQDQLAKLTNKQIFMPTPMLNYEL